MRRLLYLRSMEPKPAAAIEKVGREWFVVMKQATGKPVKFRCETLREAERFLGICNR